MLASGPRPDVGDTTLVFELPPGPFVGLRLEALTHDSLPNKGPGRADNGNFVVSEVTLALRSAAAGKEAKGLADDKPVPLTRALASFEQSVVGDITPSGKWLAAYTIDGRHSGDNVGWAIHEEVGRDQWLIVRADTYLPKEIHDTVEPFVDQFERQFAQPGVGQNGGPDAAFGLAAGQVSAPGSGQSGGQLTGGGLSLKTLIDGVSSAAAWAGAEQGSGAVHQAGGALPPGSAWFAPPADQKPAPVAALPGGFQPIAPAPIQESPRPTGSRYGNPAPTGYPVGAQSLLPLR